MERSITFRTLTRTMALLFVALLLAPLTSLPLVGGSPSVAAQASLQAVADGFDYPVGDVNGGGWGFWHGFQYYGAVYAGSYHAGEDWYRSGSAYQPVYAIGNGVVKYAAGNYPGNVVIIEHSLSNGETWYSMYGHVYAKVVVGQSVSRRQQIATIYNQAGNSHLHFEVRNFYLKNEVNGAQSACGNHRNYPPGPGYWPVPRCNGNWNGRPADKGWVNPSQFINARRTLNTIAVGQNSSRQDVFQRAYETSKPGTVYNLPYGTPTNVTYWYNGSVRQDFSGGISLIHDESADSPIRSVPAYPIFGAIRTYWEQNSWLGAPTSHMVTNLNGEVEQHFRSGWVKHSNAQQREWSGQWPTDATCTNQGQWRLEFIKLYQAAQGVGSGMTWPPNQNSTAGPSMVVCASPQRSGYAMFYDVGSGSPYNLSNYEYMLWNDYWITRLSGKISGLPASGFYLASAACDDGCDIQVKSTAFPWWNQRITSWRDQPAALVGRAWVQNGDQVNITWYERTGLARVWLKLGSSALTMPPLAAQCDASIKIADGAPVINTLTTTLTLSVTDAVEMKVSQLDTLSDATWQPYTTTLPLQFATSSSILTQTVYAQFRDTTGATLCQGAVLADETLYDALPPMGTATVAANDAVSVTLTLTATDQTDGSGVASVAVLPVTPGEPATDLTTLPDEAWQAYSANVTITKPMGYEATDPATQAALAATTDLTYQVWFRDAVGNIAAPLTVTVPYVAPAVTTLKVYLPLVIR